MMDAVRLRILLVALAGWVNRHQLEVIAYLREENRVLHEQLDGRRVRLTDAQRRRLAVNGHRLGRQGLREVATLVTPDTILLIARKLTTARARVGRPGVIREIRQLALRMARENPTWGFAGSKAPCRISGTVSPDPRSRRCCAPPGSAPCRSGRGRGARFWLRIGA